MVEFFCSMWKAKKVIDDRTPMRDIHFGAQRAHTFHIGEVR